MKQRTQMIESLRGELVGPASPVSEVQVVNFAAKVFHDPVQQRRGPLGWGPTPEDDPEEVLYYERESPHRKYGVGLLHPKNQDVIDESEVAASREDHFGAELGEESDDELEAENESETTQEYDFAEAGDDLEIASVDIRRPSTVGVSVYAQLFGEGKIHIRLPRSRKFAWQDADDRPFKVNGVYEKCERNWTDNNGRQRSSDVWRRYSPFKNDADVVVSVDELKHREVIKKEINTDGCPGLSLELQIYPRKSSADEDKWLLTIVLSNKSLFNSTQELRERTLYQTYFDVNVTDGLIIPYPESGRSFDQLDEDEKSLSLLYRESATWGIGHGCAAGWEAEPEKNVDSVFADVLPAVELPSMTPDIEIDGEALKLSMRKLSELDSEGTNPGWQDLDKLVSGFGSWIEEQLGQVVSLPVHFQEIAKSNLKSCRACLERMQAGIDLLKSDPVSLDAFRLANQSMLLQQISTKQLARRKLVWSSSQQLVVPDLEHVSPWEIYFNGHEDKERIGNWRAFQIAFLLMSLDGVRSGVVEDREIVDLIWFPTGGGKTEAYLGAMAFYMFHQRFSIEGAADGLARDGTNVLMRYTLRMLTTQQFQRAASLISAMEFMRRNSQKLGVRSIPGRRFSLGLWIGGEGSPNKISEARTQISKYRNSDDSSEGNPLVLTECPWCRSQIGRFDGDKPNKPRIKDAEWKQLRLRGIISDAQNEPRLLCPDVTCEFGQEDPDSWLPIEVIDQRIYRHPPSLVISTADKLAMTAYRPVAGSIFGRAHGESPPSQVAVPPGLIIQDELHLISGPLGTMYALYEGIFEHLCSYEENGEKIKPKIIASTATIRGADEQVNALYERSHTQLFPAPALTMGDSFFGKYARKDDGSLSNGRLYLGIHGVDYGSILTAQVRAFATALFRPWVFDETDRDAWWTLLAFYNSIRELGGARTLFDSDIRSRLKFLFNREGFDPRDRRNLPVVEELTSRLSQAGIVKMMDRLSIPYEDAGIYERVDACLASSIIEVGVDIDRLSLMGVVGQPKSTASYIQVTGRVGRRWWDRPGLIMTLYSPSKSRDRSHYEQFHSYHRRLYEQVEPTTATPFAVSAIDRAMAGALILIARQLCDAPVSNRQAYEDAVNLGFELLSKRCLSIQIAEDQQRSLDEMSRVRDELLKKWGEDPQMWEEFPPKPDGDYLMLWPGQYASKLQHHKGVVVPSSMRQVDRSAELTITQGYAIPEQE